MVDLGLPSGLKWAKCNIGAENEEDYGFYFKYGATKGYPSDQIAAFNAEPTPTTFADAATAAYGTDYRMPTKAELEELWNTDRTVETINGVKGMKFTNKSDSSKYIFIPFAGHSLNDSFYYVGNCGFLWSSTLYDKDYAYSLYYGDNGGFYTNNYLRDRGFSIRAVCE